MKDIEKGTSVIEFFFQKQKNCLDDSMGLIIMLYDDLNPS